MRSHGLVILLAILLVASLAGNLALLRGRGAADALPAGPAAATTPICPPVAELEGQLRQCRGASLALVAAALAGKDPAREKPIALTDAGISRATHAEAGPLVTPALEREALSNIALQNLRHQWEQQRDSLIGLVKSGIRDPADRADNFKQDLNELAVTLNLDASQQAAFAERTGPLRDARLDAAADQLELPSPDFAKILDAVHGLYADEDGVVRSMYGPDAADLFRATQLEKRTAILALFAMFANQPWDEHLTW